MEVWPVSSFSANLTLLLSTLFCMYPMAHQQVFLLGIEYIYLGMWMLVKKNSVIFNFARQVQVVFQSSWSCPFPFPTKCVKVLGAVHLWSTASSIFVVRLAKITGVKFYPTTITNEGRIYVHFLVFSSVHIYFFQFLLAVQRREGSRKRSGEESSLPSLVFLWQAGLGMEARASHSPGSTLYPQEGSGQIEWVD